MLATRIPPFPKMFSYFSETKCVILPKINMLSAIYAFNLGESKMLHFVIFKAGDIKSTHSLFHNELMETNIKLVRISRIALSAS